LPALLRRILCILAAVALFAPATALASGSAVVRDCTLDGKLDKHYSQSDYRDALAHLPTDVDEYTDCRDVIRSAQLAAAGRGGKRGGGTGGGGTSSGGGSTGGGTSGGGSTGGGGGGSAGAPAARAPSPNNADEALATATPQERAAVQAGRTKGAEPVQVAGQVVDPGALGFGSVGATNGVPPVLVVVLVLLGLALGAGAAQLIRNLVLARRTAS
jgi:hypothetical protein